MDSATPKDKWNLVYMTLVFHGLGTLIAWNMFITAKDYFVKYKLKDAPVYSQNFLAYMGWASQIPNVIFNWFNVFVKLGGDLSTRIVWSLFFECTLFIVTIILAMVDSTGWPGIFFWLTMISVFMMNGLNAIFQNSVFGIAVPLPPKYIGGVFLGSNICGTLVVLLSWMSKNFSDMHTAAIYYFLCGIFVLIVCLDMYLALPLNKFYRYYEKIQLQNKSVPRSRTSALKGSVIDMDIPYISICRQSAMQLYNVYLTFFVTLAVYPAVASDIHPISAGFLGDNFVLVTSFFTFNVTAMIGNITASLKQLPDPRQLTLFTTVRILFIPFFLMCNYQVVGRTLPVLIRNDYVFWFMVALLGWSSGHGSSLGMMYVGRTVSPDHAATAGMIGAAVLVTGILSGLIFTRLCPIIVSL